MPYDNGLSNTEPSKSFCKQSGLGSGGPDTRARPLAMAESGPVKAQHAIALGKKVYKAAAREVWDHCPVAMKQDNARPGRLTPLPIVKPYPIAIDELSGRRVSPLRYESEDDVPNYQENNDQEDDEENGFRCGHLTSKTNSPRCCSGATNDFVEVPRQKTQLPLELVELHDFRLCQASNSFAKGSLYGWLTQMPFIGPC